jgi:hypothetical protein
MTILVIIGGTVAALLLLDAFLALLNWLHQPRHPFDPEYRPRLLQILLHQGHDGWLMFVKRRSGTEFLRYRKYIRRPGYPGIELAFPEAPWARNYIKPLKRLLDDRGARYVVTTVPEEPVSACVLVDFGKDVRLAAEVGLAIVSDVLGAEHAAFQCYFKGPHDIRASARIGF